MILLLSAFDTMPPRANASEMGVRDDGNWPRVKLA
jgi:hypothetical protein